mgnify:CR=1 FL=1
MPLARSVVRGTGPGMSGNGSVKKMWRRRGWTGRSTPARRPTRAAAGPAAFTTTRVSTVPDAVTTAVARPPRTSIPATSTPSTMRAPSSRARRAKAFVTSAGPAMPSFGAPHRGDQVVDVKRGHQRLGLARRDDAHVDAEASLQRHPGLVSAEILGVGDQEQIADLPVAGVDAELVLEPLEDPDRLEGEADLGLRGELGANAARRLARGARADRVPLEHEDVARAAPGQVIGDAASDHAAADDDHVCRLGRGPWRSDGSRSGGGAHEHHGRVRSATFSVWARAESTGTGRRLMGTFRPLRIAPIQVGRTRT